MPLIAYPLWASLPSHTNFKIYMSRFTVYTRSFYTEGLIGSPEPCKEGLRLPTLQGRTLSSGREVTAHREEAARQRNSAGASAPPSPPTSRLSSRRTPLARVL